MKAVVMTQSGDADVLQLREVETPRITSPTQLLVKLMAAGVNPLDTKLRARGTYYPDRMPAVLGCDGAGVVVEVGDAVRDFQPGDGVYYCNGGIGGEPGNYAEYTTIDESFAVRKPDSLSFSEAAAAPLVLITAYESLFDRMNVQPEQRVLIHAGAGGVGHVAIQLAHDAGARVATTVSNEEKEAFVTGLGAELPICYHAADFAAACRGWSGGEGVDGVFDTVGGKAFSVGFTATRHYGHVVTLLDPPADANWKEARLRNLTVSFELMLTPMLHDLHRQRLHQAQILTWAGKLFDEGKLKMHVAREYPLEEAAEAHRAIEAGSTVGKLVLRISQ